MNLLGACNQFYISDWWRFNSFNFYVSLPLILKKYDFRHNRNGKEKVDSSSKEWATIPAAEPGSPQFEVSPTENAKPENPTAVQATLGK